MRAFYNCLNDGVIEIPGLNVDIVGSLAKHIDTQSQNQCLYCGGFGHDAKDCMTNIQWSRTAKQSGLGFHYGAIKGLAYYRRLERNMDLPEYVAMQRAPKVVVKVVKKGGNGFKRK